MGHYVCAIAPPQPLREEAAYIWRAQKPAHVRVRVRNPHVLTPVCCWPSLPARVHWHVTTRPVCGRSLRHS